MSPTLNSNESALSDEQSERMRALAQGGDKDAERVLTLAKAANQENAEAQFYLAHSLQEGALGLTRDPERARKLFAWAAKNGYPGAQAELDRLEKPAASSLSPKNAGVNVKLPPLAPKQQELARFDDAIIRLSVRAYMLSMPIFFKENDLVALMGDRGNHAHFVEGGLVILYLKTAGSAMAHGALASDGESSAESMFGTSAKTQNLAKHADDKMNQMRSQGIALGQDFLWLAGVLPAAAKGDYGPFQAHSQLSPYRQAMLSQIQTWRMNPQVGQAIIAQMQGNFSTVEQELYDAVCQLDISLPAGYAPPQPQSEPVLIHQENASSGLLSQQQSVDQCREAAEQEKASAQTDLGAMYEEGRGVKQDYTMAEKYYRIAAEQGVAVAQSNLGAIYMQGLVAGKDDKEAIKWLRKAADQGVARAQSNLGLMIIQGRGVEQNDDEAVRWFRKSAEQGFAEGQVNLGVSYTNGRGVEKNDAEAAKWFRKAAEHGSVDGQKLLDRVSREVARANTPPQADPAASSVSAPAPGGPPAGVAPATSEAIAIIVDTYLKGFKELGSTFPDSIEFAEPSVRQMLLERARSKDEQVREFFLWLARRRLSKVLQIQGKNIQGIEVADANSLETMARESGVWQWTDADIGGRRFAKLFQDCSDSAHRDDRLKCIRMKLLDVMWSRGKDPDVNVLDQTDIAGLFKLVNEEALYD